jgi:hypothetical protein
MIGQREILSCVTNNLQSLSFSRQKQEILVEFGEMLGFSVKDVDQGLAHIVVMGGAIGRGETWPLGWRDARLHLSAEQVSAIEAEYLKIVDGFPQDLKDGHPKVFVEPHLVGTQLRG